MLSYNLTKIFVLHGKHKASYLKYLYEFKFSDGDNNTYLMRDLNGVFSYDDLYAVIDSSNPNTTVTELDDAGAWQASSFIPLGSSDLKQLHDESAQPSVNKDGTSPSTEAEMTLTGTSSGAGGTSGLGDQTVPFHGYSNGSFLRYLTRANETSVPSTVTLCSLETASQDSSSSHETANSLESARSASGGEESGQATANAAAVPAQQAKVRKPRGRKPKHVKEAELAAARAQEALAQANIQPKLQGTSTASGNEMRTQTSEDKAPLVAVHLPSTQTQEQHQQRPGPHQTLGQLAYHDRRLILMRRHTTPNPPMQPPFAVRQQQNGNRFPSPAVALPPPQPYRNQSQRNIPHPNYATASLASAQSGRLDQLFSSRIAAPSNKTTVKPNIIQENRSIYNLLTAPTIPRPGGGATYDHLKIKQMPERWTQMPNPQILPDHDNGHSTSANALPRLEVKNEPQVNASDGSSRNFPPPPPSAYHHVALGVGLTSTHKSTPTASSSATASRTMFGPPRVNIRRDQLPTADLSNSSTIGGSLRGSSHLRICNNNAWEGTCGSSSCDNCHGGNLEMQQRLELLQHDNNRLRCKNHYLMRIIKQQTALLRRSYEAHQELKLQLQTNQVLVDYAAYGFAESVEGAAASTASSTNFEDGLSLGQQMDSVLGENTGIPKNFEGKRPREETATVCPSSKKSRLEIPIPMDLSSIKKEITEVDTDSVVGAGEIAPEGGNANNIVYPYQSPTEAGNRVVTSSTSTNNCNSKTTTPLAGIKEESTVDLVMLNRMVNDATPMKSSEVDAAGSPEKPKDVGKIVKNLKLAASSAEEIASAGQLVDGNADK